MLGMFRTISVTTSWAGLGDVVAGRVSILNNTGAALQVRAASDATTGHSITLKDGQSSPPMRLMSRNIGEIELQAGAAAEGVELFLD